MDTSASSGGIAEKSGRGREAVRNFEKNVFFTEMNNCSIISCDWLKIFTLVNLEEMIVEE
jgi:hypothetical protein